MSSRIVIERIATECELLRCATIDDLSFVARFGSASRRSEVLAWRAIVRHELGTDVDIFYDDYGAPKVNRPNVFISVSHSRDMVAVLFADRTCAVDIESAGRDFHKVASRYLSAEEQIIAEQNDIYAEIWSAKEALYKYYSKGELDLVKHISIEEYDEVRGVLMCSILDSEPIEVKINREGDLVVAMID